MFDIESIKSPAFIKRLTIKELKILAEEIRQFLIENISETGGHLSSNLGVVEITLAMYYVFDPEKDKFLFDVGHQSYVHKILTGRASEFKTLRKYGGISGYISRNESKYDIWESGHSSTSLSAMAGILTTAKEDEKVVTVIGDSSMMNGVALEGLNYIGQVNDKRAIIIFNDNKMGISKSVGALTKMFSRLRGSAFYRGFKAVLTKIFPEPIVHFFHRVKRSIKGFIQVDNFFEDFGYDYYGPYNGNDLKTIIKLFKRIDKHPKQPVVLHLQTTKGKGYKFSEDDIEGHYHGVSPFDIETGKPKNEDYSKTSYSLEVADYLVEKRKEHNFMVITPAMKAGAKLDVFSKLYPKDFIDVGIAEEHATVMSAGAALYNKDVVLLMYSTFAQRSFDEFLNDIARQNLKVIVGVDRAGVVGEDGVTHQGLYDVSMFMMMPNFIVTMPRNLHETIGLFNYAFTVDHPIVIRYPRKSEARIEMDLDYITTLDWEKIHEGNKLNILGYGPDVERLKTIVENNNISANVYDCKCIKPMDLKCLKEIFDNNLPIMVFEQVVASGTLYQKVLEFKEENSYTSKVYKHSFNSEDLIPHGSLSEIYEHYGLSDSEFLKAIKEVYND